MSLNQKKILNTVFATESYMAFAPNSIYVRRGKQFVTLTKKLGTNIVFTCTTLKATTCRRVIDEDIVVMTFIRK